VAGGDCVLEGAGQAGIACSQEGLHAARRGTYRILYKIRFSATSAALQAIRE
jgi:hypothetical protein